MGMNDIINYQRKLERVENLLKSKGLGMALTKLVIYPHKTNLEPIHVAQAHGLHLKTVQVYYEVLGTFLESEYNEILDLLTLKPVSFIS